MFLEIGLVYVFLKAIRSDQLIIGACSIPLPLSCLALFLASTADKRIFLGSQPRLGQVPPHKSLSMMPTFLPAFANPRAAEFPATPPPIITIS